MRLRLLGAAGAAVVATSLLAGCQSNVGVAARIDGTTVSETQLSNYVTPNAQSVQGSSGQTTAPKPFVLTILIDNQLLRAVLAQSKSGPVTPGRLTTLEHQFLNGKTPEAEAAALKVKGYSSSFDEQIVEYVVLTNQLNSAFSSSAEFSAALQKVDFPVSVNPRYGVWNAKQHNLESGPSQGRPSYLRLQRGTSPLTLQG